MTNYADAGVDIDAGNRAVKLMGDAVRSTNTPAVLSEVARAVRSSLLLLPENHTSASQLVLRRR